MGSFLCCISNTASNQDVSVGLVKKRGCTDVPWLLIFMAFMTGMGYVIYLCLALGDPMRLVYGVDSWGNTCNRENEKLDLDVIVPLNGRDMTGLDNAYYFNFLAAGSSGLINSTVICVADCPNTIVVTVEDLKNLSSNYSIHLCRYNVAVDDFANGSLTGDICPPVPLGPFKSILNRCVPAQAITAGISMFSAAADGATEQADAYSSSTCTATGNLFERIAGDLMKVYPTVAWLSAISFAIALLVTLLMGFIAAILIRVLVIGMAVGSVAGSGLCWYMWYSLYTKLNKVAEAERLEDDKNYVSYWLYGAIVITVLAVIILLVLLIMRKRIALVIQLFHEAGNAMLKMPMLMILPLFTLICLLITAGGLAYGYMYIFSAGEPEVDATTGHVAFETNMTIFYMKWYYLLGILWIIQLFFACQTMIIAGSVADWYFTRDKSSLGCCTKDLPIISSVWRLVRYHLGTVLFGSFIIAAVQFARIILMYLQKQLKGRQNKVLVVILKILSCCFWILEKILKFFTKNAYIMSSIYGCNLCTGGQRALKTIMNNILRVGAINSIGVFTLFIGKMLIVASVVVIGVFLFAERSDLCYVWVPLVLLAIISYAIADVFLSVYGMAIDTIFLCFCVDSDFNDGNRKPFFMSKRLMKFVDKAAVSYSRERIEPIREEGNNNNLNNVRNNKVRPANPGMQRQATRQRTTPKKLANQDIEW